MNITCGAGVPVRFAEIIEERLRERRCVSGDRPLALVIDQSLTSEEYAIADHQSVLTISGNSPITLLAGIGHFLRSSRYENGEFIPSAWRGRSAPLKPVRGIYFATHFYNYYHAAPIAEVARYIEDLALWGYNALHLWFDMHHYRNIDDPLAQEMIVRLQAFFKKAKELGMAVGLGVLANEAYRDSPAALRAEPVSGHGGFYGVELCPSKPAGLAQIVVWLKGVFDAFAACELDYLWIWPYDQGGCNCAECAPWGANGFLKAAKEVALSFKEKFLRGRVILSTWDFDHSGVVGEWQGLSQQIGAVRRWADFLLANGRSMDMPAYLKKHGAPGGMPILNFPEISMYGMTPWGGFGANPLPATLQRLFDESDELISGGYPYSEGIFEDINKTLIAQFYWSGCTASATLRDYIAYEFSAEVVDLVLDLIAILESNHVRHWEDGDYNPPYRHCIITADHGHERAVALAQQIDRRLPAWARQSWRWRIIYLRALIDQAFFQSDGYLTQAMIPLFDELKRLYHVTAMTNPCLQTPTVE